MANTFHFPPCDTMGYVIQVSLKGIFGGFSKKYLTLSASSRIHFVTICHFVTNQEAQLWLLIVFWLFYYPTFFIHQSLIFQSSSFKTDSNRKLPFFGLFLRQTGMWEPNPPKNVQVFFADSESCENCGDFGTWVGRWSKWNNGVRILSHIFHANVVITGKPSY